MPIFRLTPPPQHVIHGNSARQRRWVDITQIRKALSAAGGSRGPTTRSLRSALERLYRTSLFDRRRFNAEWNLRKHLPPQPLPDPPVPCGGSRWSYPTHICSRHQQESHVPATCAYSANVRLPTGRRNFNETLSQRLELLLCFVWTLGNPCFLYLAPFSQAMSLCDLNNPPKM